MTEQQKQELRRLLGAQLTYSRLMANEVRWNVYNYLCSFEQMHALSLCELRMFLEFVLHAEGG